MYSITKKNSKYPYSKPLFYNDEKYGSDTSDIIAVKNSIKPFFWTLANSKEKLDIFKKIAKDNNLIIDYQKHVFNPKKEKKYNQIFTKENNFFYNVYIAKKENVIKKAKKIILRGFTLRKGYTSKDIGILLGYPSCCVESFLELNIKKSILTLKPFAINKIPFYNNNLLTGSSSNCLLSGHAVCSYNCKKSLAYNKKILEAIQKDMPSYYDFLKTYLKKPLLIWRNNCSGFALIDTMVVILFDGELVGKILTYSDIYPHFPINHEAHLDNFPSEETISFLQRGNKVVFYNKKFIIYRDKKKIGEIKRSEDTAILVQPK